MEETKTNPKSVIQSGNRIEIAKQYLKMSSQQSKNILNILAFFFYKKMHSNGNFVIFHETDSD